MSDILARNQELVDVAMGRSAADLVIRNGRWVCVQSGEIIEHTDIAVVKGLIAYVGPDAGHTIRATTQLIDAKNRFLVPGLLDAHMHVESGMLTVTEFVRAVLPSGTTGMFIDPHEIANVLGLKGVRLMVEEAQNQPVHVWVQVPSCVPSAPGFETPGASLSADEVAEALTWQGVIGLGEVMDFPGVFNNQEKIGLEILAAQRLGKVVGGHYASADLGLPFSGYVAGGPEDDHEGTTVDDALFRIRQGMKVMMRYGSAWHDIVQQVKAVTQYKLDRRNFLLCTDDCHSGTLVKEGHIDRAVRVAINAGLDPMYAIQMSTINTAEHFGVSRLVGQIAPGRSADILVVSDLMNFHIDTVIAKGYLAVQDGRLLIEHKHVTYPEWVRESVKLNQPVSEQDFIIRYPRDGVVRANVIGILENQAPNRHLQVDMVVKDGILQVDEQGDLASLAIVERHHHTGRIQLGLVKGFGFNVPCAVATSVAHDSHHIIVVGTDPNAMALAVNRLAEIGGGQIVIQAGKESGLVPLPIGGLMSDQPAEVVAEQMQVVLNALQQCGCSMNNPNMQISLLALVVIPELRISDLGLVDVTQFKFIPVLESETDL